MQETLRMAATMLPGHRLEIRDPALPEGARVAVMVVLPEKQKTQPVSMLTFLESLPAGPRALPTWDAFERHLREEKDSWER